MTDWYKLELGDAIFAQAELQSIGEHMRRFRVGADSGGSPAVYVRYATAAALHCHVTVYFGPGAGELARHLRADSCPLPSLAGLEALLPEPS